MTETRVGKVTIDILARECKEYIKANIKDHKYTGDLHYLKVAEQYDRYLRE